jgi:hypothetical protein
MTNALRHISDCKSDYYQPVDYKSTGASKVGFNVVLSINIAINKEAEPLILSRPHRQL